MNINTDNPTLMSFSHTEVTFWVTTLAAEVRVHEPERHTACSQAGPVPPSIMTCHCARLPGLGLMQPQLGFNPTKALSWAQGKVTVVDAQYWGDEKRVEVSVPLYNRWQGEEDVFSR